ncbi:hypothetical protein [Klebsiella sp. BIGb0407]|uniref:hypothetical protein n=1 Tax=Klebsiella sp. BIGb0407 TaxID=2940603 RepID=UPI002167A708|nr:hypothetical protein [Klebsiella sp. BIGb0407]MCS3433495.1 hypothetical protein [Klebsiella sp. BIGb0407]
MYSENTRSFLNLLDEQIVSNDVIVYLEGGHYNSNYGPDDFSINSLNEAIYFSKQIIKKHKKGVRLAFGILIDNLGLNCSNNNTCEIKNTTDKNEVELNQEIEAIIQLNKLIKRDKFIIFNERTTKNRAIDSLKKIKNNKELIMSKEVDGKVDIMYEKDEVRFLLAKKNENRISARCPLLMAQHYKDIISTLNKRYNNHQIIIFDWSQIEDKTKVTQGRLALKLFSDEQQMPVNINNIFYIGDDNEMVEIVED